MITEQFFLIRYLRSRLLKTVVSGFTESEITIHEVGIRRDGTEILEEAEKLNKSTKCPVIWVRGKVGPTFSFDFREEELSFWYGFCKRDLLSACSRAM